MPPTQIERFLFGTPPIASLITGFSFSNATVKFQFVPVGMDVKSPTTTANEAVFQGAVITSIDEDRTERGSWPLDLIGFDSYADGASFRFVRNCGTVEWCWTSDWPTLNRVGE